MNATQFHLKGILWFKSTVAHLLENGYEMKYASASEGDLGALEAVEFNSVDKGGYVHFWSSGYIGFELVSYESGEAIVQDSMVEWEKSSKSFEDVLAPLLEGLSNRPS